MNQHSLKQQAQEIVVAVDHDLQNVETKPQDIQEQVNTKANALMNSIYKVVGDVDLAAAAAQVQALREKYPEATSEELSKRLIRDKCEATGKVGAATSGAALIPGIGTAAALTLGVAADIGATFKLNAELVLELAALYEYPLTDDEKQRLVMVITGLSAGTTTLSRKVGEKAAAKIAEQYAFKSVTKFLPIIGVAASAGTNVLATYIIGQRADAYFRLGPEAMGSWADNLRAITGVDERTIAAWLAESGKATGAALVSGAGKAGKVAGSVGSALGSGAQKAGQTAQKGVKVYLRWLVAFWTAVFRFIGKIFGFIWRVVLYIPRKVVGLFKRKQP
jgi:hypothetical protein